MADSPMTKDEIQAYVSRLIDYALDHIESEYEKRREDNWLYYHGKSSVPKQEGRHSITMAKARDIIRMVEPAVLRPFATEPNCVEFKGRTPSAAKDARDITMAMRYWFYSRNDGYRLLADAVREGLVCDAAVMKSWWDANPTKTTHHLTNLTMKDLADLRSLPEVDIISMDPEDVTTPGDEPRVSVVMAETKDNGKLVIEGVPLEHFFIDSGAKSIETSRVHGHKEEITIGEGVMRGLDREMLLQAVGEDTRNEAIEEARRNVADSDTDYVAGVEDSLPVTIYEAYVRLDPKGSGDLQLHKCLLAGDSGGTMLGDPEPVDESPFVVGSLYPLPYSPFGEGLVDGLKDDQDAFTSIMREMLDNLQLSNRPGKEVVEGMVNMADLMNTELGSIIRTRAPNMIKDFTVPFIAGQGLPLLQFLDDQTERKTGISSAAMGFSPDMLQSTTKAAVDAANQAAQGQIEYMARNFAETVLKPLFRRCMKLLAMNMDRPFWIGISDEMVQIDPRGWDLDVDIEVNVGLGKGRIDEKMMALQMMMATQKEILNSRGIGNGMVSLTQYLDCIGDMMALTGLHNISRYIGPVTPEIEKQMAEQDAKEKQAAMQGGQQQGAGGPTSDAIVIAETIRQKTRLQELSMKGQLEMAQKRIDMQLKMIESMRDDDLQRDKMLQDLILEAAELEAKYGAQIQTAAIVAAQKANNPPNGGQRPQ